MEPISVVLYQKDPATAQILASGLSQRFASVRLARSYEEICPEVARHRAEAVVLDLEASSWARIGWRMMNCGPKH